MIEEIREKIQSEIDRLQAERGTYMDSDSMRVFLSYSRKIAKYEYALEVLEDLENQ